MKKERFTTGQDEAPVRIKNNKRNLTPSVLLLYTEVSLCMSPSAHRTQ